MEVVVSLVILAFAFGGVFAAFISVRKYVNRANKRLISMNLARRYLESLYSQVDAEFWDKSSSALSEGSHKTENFFIDNYNYTGIYQVSKITNQQYREVKATFIYE